MKAKYVWSSSLDKKVLIFILCSISSFILLKNIKRVPFAYFPPFLEGEESSEGPQAKWQILVSWYSATV